MSPLNSQQVTTWASAVAWAEMLATTGGCTGAPASCTCPGWQCLPLSELLLSLGLLLPSLLGLPLRLLPLLLGLLPLGLLPLELLPRGLLSVELHAVPSTLPTWCHN